MGPTPPPAKEASPPEIDTSPPPTVSELPPSPPSAPSDPVPPAPVPEIPEPAPTPSHVWQRPIIQYIEEPSLSALRVRAETEEVGGILEGQAPEARGEPHCQCKTNRRRNSKE